MNDKADRHALLTSPEFLVDPNVEIDGDPDITSRLSESERVKLLAAATLCTFRQGDHLFRQGDAHRGIHVIQSGKIRSLYTSPTGREFTLAYWTKGHFVGAPQVLGGGDNLWTSVAEENSTTLFMRPGVLQELIRAMPALALGLIDGLAYKAALYARIAQVVGTTPISARLALLLLSLAERDGAPGRNELAIRGRHSQERLAMMVGSTRQAVTQLLDRFEKAGLIARDGRSLRIIDAAGLEDLQAG